MDKQTKIGFMFMFFLAVALFVSAEVSAIELNPFGNVKDYDNNIQPYGQIDISETFMWVKTNKISENKLFGITADCITDCSGWGESNLYKKDTLFSGSKFLDKAGSEKQKDSLKYYINSSETYVIQVPQYSEVCKETILNSTNTTQNVCYQEITSYKNETKTREVFVPYNFETLEPGIYKWKYDFKKLPQEKVDFVPIIQGIDGKEWVWYDSNYPYCFNLYVNNTIATAREQTIADVFLNVSSLTHKPYNNSVRVVNQPCNNGGSEVPSGVYQITQSSGLMSAFRLVISNETWAGNQNKTYGVYYDTSSHAQTNTFNLTYSNDATALKLKSPIFLTDLGKSGYQTYWNGFHNTSVMYGGAWKKTTDTNSNEPYTYQDVYIQNLATSETITILDSSLQSVKFNRFSSGNYNVTYTAYSNGWIYAEADVLAGANYYGFSHSFASTYKGKTRLSSGSLYQDDTIGNKVGEMYGIPCSEASDCGYRIAVAEQTSLTTEGTLRTNTDQSYWVADGTNQHVSDSNHTLIYKPIQKTNTTQWTNLLADIVMNRTFTTSIGAEEINEGVSITLNSPADNLQSTTSAINFNATITPNDATIKNVTLYINNEEYLNLYDTNETINYSKILTLEDGDYTWNITACWIGESTEEDCTESDTRTFSIDATLPNITILSGNGTYPYYYSGINHTVNFTIEDDNLDSVWWRYGEEEMEILDTNLSADLFDGDFSTGPLLNLDTDFDTQYYILLNRPGGDLNLSTSWCQESWVNCEYHHSDIFSTSMCETDTIIVNRTHDDSDWWNNVNFMHFYCGNIYIGNASISSNMLSPKIFSEIQVEGVTYNLSGTLNISEDNNYSVTFPVTKDVYDFKIYANDTFGNVASKEVEWDYYVYENNVVYNPTTTEGKIEDFVFSLTTTSEITAAIFNYDGVRSSANIYSSGTNKTISINDYEIPSIETNKNITFFLELTLTGGIKINSTSYIQSVKNLGFDDCSSNTFPLMNMSLYDEKAKTPLTGTIEVNYWIENALFTNKIATYNNTFSSTNSKRICSNVNLSGQGLYQSAIIRYSATGYVPEFYNVQRAEVDGVQYIKLYDLNESDSTEFLVTYYNDNFIKVSGAILQLLRGYIDKDIYDVVEAPLTSSEGTAIVHVDTKTNLYKAILVKDGVILNTFNELVFACESPLVTQCEMKLSGKVEPSTSIDTADLQDISYEISTINNTVNFLFSIPSGVTSSVNLIMKQTDSFGTTQLCNKTVSSAGGTIECDFDDTIGESYVTLYVYKDGIPIVHKQYAIMEDSPLKFLGNNFFIVFIMLLSVVGMAFSSPEWIIINASVTLLISGSLWLLNGMDFVIGIGAIMWLLVGAIILISKLAKQEDR